jgi:L-fuconate dehydratase
MFDFVAVSGSMDGRVIEYVDHLHEHFVDPVRIRDGRYLVPDAPGYSVTMKAESLARFEYPDGPGWAEFAGRTRPPAGVGGAA